VITNGYTSQPRRTVILPNQVTEVAGEEASSLLFVGCLHLDVPLMIVAVVFSSEPPTTARSRVIMGVDLARRLPRSCNK
jgi:hypothetical protein